jgi:hypothetical protein
MVMSKKKETTKPEGRYKFSPEELERMKQYLEKETAQKEIIGLLDGFSGSFADWSIIISEAVHETMAKKQQSNMDCEKECKMLENLTYLFTKLAYHSETLSEWHKKLTFGKGYTEQMIADGHP